MTSITESHSSVRKLPVAIIVFRRPDLTKLVLSAIAEVKPEKLFVIADGPRPGRQDDLEAVMATRALFDALPWRCEVIRIFAETNLGLRNRVISGLDEVFKQVESAIILEDDCLPSPDFFEFASHLIARYQNSPSVCLISANNFAPQEAESDTYYFSTHANIWGWATWRRTWLEFRNSRPVSELSANEFEKILKLVEGRRQRASFAKLLRLSGSLDSWAIQFAAFVYLNGYVSAVPSQNLVTNVGFGSGSTHTKFESWADEIPLGKIKFPLRHPTDLEANILEMRRESRVKARRWLTYPICHPLNALARVFRYLRIKLSL